MNYYCFDMDGLETDSGIINQGNIPEIETHGSISIEVGNRWLNFKTNEDLRLSMTDMPEHWED